MLISQAKKIGLTMKELNELTSQDFLDIAESYIGKKESRNKQATQSDIDNFFM